MSRARASILLERLLARARGSSTVRATTTGIDCDAATADDRLSLFVVVSLAPRARWEGSPLLNGRPFLQTLGFAGNWSSALVGQPRRFPAIDVQTIDRFVSFGTSTSTRALATVRIRETYAYDLTYRSEINATGVSVRIDLHPQALGAIVEFLESHVASDHAAESRSGCVFRIPVRQAIRFPEPRGGENPYTGSTNGVEPLNDIATLHSQALQVAVMIHPASPAIAWETQPLGPRIGASTVLNISM